MIYRDRMTGKGFSGRTAAAVVSCMRRCAWMAPGKLLYMLEVRDRVGVIVPGVLLDVTTPALFLDSLVLANLLTKEC